MINIKQQLPCGSTLLQNIHTYKEQLVHQTRSTHRLMHASKYVLRCASFGGGQGGHVHAASPARIPYCNFTG